MKEKSKTMVYCTMSWKQTLYVLIMHTLIVSSSVAALLFIKHKKIPLNRYQNLPGLVFLYMYVIMACGALLAARESDSDSSDLPDERVAPGSFLFVAECLSHSFGLALVVFVFSIISPKLALCVGIPAAVYFISATVYICRPSADDLQPNQSRLPM